MSRREKVEDDPLSMFGNINKEIVQPTPLEPEEEVVFRELDTSKVKFKNKVKKEISVPIVTTNKTEIKATDTHSGIKASSGLGFNVNLWENDTKSTNNANSLWDDEKPTSTIDSGLFSKPVVKPSQQQNFQSSQTKKSNKIRMIGEEDDTNIDELKVAALLEREEDNEYDMFGKSNVASKGGNKIINTTTTTKTTSTNLNHDDLDLSHLDKLSTLEKEVETDDLSKYLATMKKPLSKTSVASPSPAAEVDVDISKLDMNDYISKQSSSSGGLFD